MRKNLLSTLLLFVSILLIHPLSAQSFIGDPVDPISEGIDITQDMNDLIALRSRYVRIGSEKLGDVVQLPLFPDATFQANRVRTEQHGSITSWVGKINNHPTAYVIISEKEGTMFAKIVDESFRQFLIVRRAKGIYVIQEIESSLLAEDIHDAVIDENAGNASGGAEAAGICDVGYSCSSQTVDLMVVYTSDAKSQLGGTNASAEAAIATAVAEMNTANSLSAVNHSFQLAHSQEISYTETNNSSTDLGRLRTYGDGYLDVVHPLRYSHQADLVCLISGTSSYCGRGYLQTSPTAYFASNGFCVANYSCMTGNLTMAHEFGHNMGLRHDDYVDGSTTPCSHNHGYVNQAANPASSDYTGNSGQRWRTILGYNNECASWGFNCSRIVYWSNPSVNYSSGTGGGPGSGVDPMGIAPTDPDPADNAYMLNRAICLTANLSTQLTPLPVEFSDIEIRRSENAFQLNWKTQFEHNNEGFWVQAQLEGEAEFVELGFVPGKGDSQHAQSYQYETKPLAPGRYQFRLRQVDFDGKTSDSRLLEGIIPFDASVSLLIAPNPFSEKTSFQLSLAETQPVFLNIYDMMGKEMFVVHEGVLEQGQHHFSIGSANLANGVYLYRLSGNGVFESGKLIKQ